MSALRSLLFKTVFYFWAATASLFCAPALLFMNRTQILGLVYWWTRTVGVLERRIAGLRLEVRGLENLPGSGAYILAAKHESAYETLKLHSLLGDPAIVLKKELLSIPVWGRFLAALKPIAIDRSQGKAAMAQVIEGARETQKQNRPIVIFPQGTRVFPHQTPKERPYKLGVARVQEATGLPVIPMALNSGMYWPKRGRVRAGTIVFEFLPPVPPEAPPNETIQTLERLIETGTKALHDEARKELAG